VAVVPRIGTEFAGYRIEALLGRGGMSVVYRAENARLGNRVALKLLAESLADDESFRERFVRESRTAAMLNHPNIVTIYDAGDWEGVLYIAMRWVEEDLKAHLRREGPLAPDHALAVAAQVGSALDAAHTRGLLHRDVKPANILLEPGEPGAPPIAYLADFGLTKHLESRSGITASGQFVGTIDYMSPEQIEGREVDSRTDIYSLGCVIFESLAGGTPFHRETEVAVLWAHMREDPPPLSEVRPDLPRELDVVLRKAMAKSPEDRYGSCRELVADLRHALGVAAVETYAGRTVDEPERRPASSERTVVQRRTGPRRRWLVPAAALSAAALLSGLAGIVGYELIRDVKPQIIGPRSATPSPAEEILGQSIPISLSGHCKSTEPLTPDFNAGYVCTKVSPDVTKLEYYKPISGSRMGPYIQKRAEAEGLNRDGGALDPEGSCSIPPGIHEWRRQGKLGHGWLTAPLAEGNGRVLCYRWHGWAAIEWSDRDADVYSIVYGRDLIGLRRWWQRNGGPIVPS
jgi:serine/threonine-protein kinase